MAMVALVRTTSVMPSHGDPADRDPDNEDARLIRRGPGWISANARPRSVVSRGRRPHPERLAVPPDSDSLRTLARRSDGPRRGASGRGRVDDRRGARPRHARARGLFGRDSRCLHGPAPRSLGLQDRRDRLDGPGGWLSHRDLISAIWRPLLRLVVSVRSAASWLSGGGYAVCFVVGCMLRA